MKTGISMKENKVNVKVNKTAEDFAVEQKEISVSEFFEKNKHLLGFDNPTKALLMAVKEAVDNSLDACTEADIVPDLYVKIKQLGEDKYRVTVQDNGPGIVKEQMPRIFAKLLYGSKFFKFCQSRGQQGIGISAVALYSQLTTGQAFKVWSNIGKDKTYYYELLINISKNEPEIVKDQVIDGGTKGIKIECDVVGRFRKTQSIEDYLKQCSVSNPFAKITYVAPDGTKTIFPRSINELPKKPREIAPHPYGVEHGILLRMLKRTSSRTLSSFLTNEFSSVGSLTAKEICKTAKLDVGMKPEELVRENIEKLVQAMQSTKVQRPPLDCLSPIGNNELEKSIKREYPSVEFVTAVTREPTVYRGNPFQIEVAIAYGGDIEKDGAVEVMRFANRVPLLYQAGACATIEAVKDVDWKRYNLSQSGNNLPQGPAMLIIHMVSIWVPFVSESKEAIASYPEIVGEMKLAIQEVGRRLSTYLSGKRRAGEAQRRLNIFTRYAGETASALEILTGKSAKDLEKRLKDAVENKNKMKEFVKVEEVK